MINEELLREADLGEGSVEILDKLNGIESKLDEILQAVRPPQAPTWPGPQASPRGMPRAEWQEMMKAAAEEEEE